MFFFQELLPTSLSSFPIYLTSPNFYWFFAFRTDRYIDIDIDIIYIMSMYVCIYVYICSRLSTLNTISSDPIDTDLPLHSFSINS